MYKNCGMSKLSFLNYGLKKYLLLAFGQIGSATSLLSYRSITIGIEER